ncbi:MAG: corrinoid protein [Firmicutes bacterium]|nr:corrinoid protein [Bacillota bacterium]
MNRNELFNLMADAVLKGDKAGSIKLAEDSIEMGIDPRTAIEEGFTPGMNKTGELWDEGVYFLPELVMSAEAMKAAMGVLKPVMTGNRAGAASSGTVVIGTVEGDIHDIGKTIVAALLEAAGFNVVDLGFDVPEEKFISEAEAHNADIIGMSALLTTTMFGQKRLISRLRELGKRDKYKIMVGGAPVSEKWAKDIGADSAPGDAMNAVRAAKELMGAVKAY